VTLLPAQKVVGPFGVIVALGTSTSTGAASAYAKQESVPWTVK